ncbi:MAG: VWA-like domain-containing protein [Pseudomonadota bacterium]
MSQHTKRATGALQKLIETDPAFGSLSLWCIHRDSSPETITVFQEGEGALVETFEIAYEIAPAYTDGRTIYYGSAFEDFDLDEKVAVCAHEILHIAFQHIPRGKALSERFGPRYSPLLFNIATDALINETLALANHKLPQPCIRLLPILTMLGIEEQVVKMLQELDAEKLYVKLLEAVEADNINGKTIQDLLAAQGVDIRPLGHVSAQDRIEGAEWDQRLKRAMAQGRQAGRGVGKVVHRIGDVPKSKTPWELILRRLVTKAVTRRPTPSFLRPTRRWLALDAHANRTGRPRPVYEPGSHLARSRPRVAVCVDVSASISTLMINRFAGEIAGIGKRTGAEIHLIVFDHGIQLVTKLEGADFSTELKSLRFKSGGGTSFIEPVRLAVDLDPSIIIVLTDLMGPFGDKPQNVSVIWACPTGYRTAAPFGRVVSLVG